MPIPVPLDASPEVQRAFQQISDALDVIMGVRNVDWKGRRIINAGEAIQDADYVTLAQVKKLITTATASAGTGGSSTGGGGSDIADTGNDMMRISLRG